MTLSSLLGSITRREGHAARPPATFSASSPDVLAWLRTGCVVLAPASQDEADLGPTDDVRARIADVLPGVTFTDEGHGAFTRTGYVVAFDTGCAARAESVRVEITGGVAALPSLQRLMAKTGWRLEPAG